MRDRRLLTADYLKNILSYSIEENSEIENIFTSWFDKLLETLREAIIEFNCQFELKRQFDHPRLMRAALAEGDACYSGAAPSHSSPAGAGCRPAPSRSTCDAPLSPVVTRLVMFRDGTIQVLSHNYRSLPDLGRMSCPARDLSLGIYPQPVGEPPEGPFRNGAGAAAFTVRPHFGIGTGASQEVETVALMHQEYPIRVLERKRRLVLGQQVARRLLQTQHLGVVHITTLQEESSTTPDQLQKESIRLGQTCGLIGFDQPDHILRQTA
jgi:hypothetical protein